MCELPLGFQSVVHSSGESIEAEWVKSSTDNFFCLTYNMTQKEINNSYVGQTKEVKLHIKMSLNAELWPRFKTLSWTSYGVMTMSVIIGNVPFHKSVSSRCTRPFDAGGYRRFCSIRLPACSRL